MKTEFAWNTLFSIIQKLHTNQWAKSHQLKNK